MRHAYYYDVRIDYNPREVKQYRYKNVEISLKFDFYIPDDLERKIGTAELFEILRLVGQLTKDIFISETNFIQFPEIYIEGIPEGFFETQVRRGKNTYLTIEYTDYGTDFTKTNVVKAFARTIEIPESIMRDIIEYYWEMRKGLTPSKTKRDRFVNYLRKEITEIIAEELTGRPGRKKKKGGEEE